MGESKVGDSKVAPVNDSDSTPADRLLNQRGDDDGIGSKKKRWFSRTKSGRHLTQGKGAAKTIEDQDFSWSAHLWQEAADKTFWLALFLFLTFTVGGTVGFKYIEDWSWVDSVYFVFATLTTVGYGDISPSTALGREIGIVFIVLGVTTLGFVFSFLLQYSAAHSADASLEFQKKFENLDKGMHVSELQKLIDHRRHAVKKKALLLILKLAAMVGLFVAIYCGILSWDLRDTVYFIVVTSTTVGYGDVLPSTDAEKIITIITMIISTVIMGQILGGAVDLYVVDILEEQIKKKIIESATYVHLCDLEGDGTINEAEYTIFKLLQLQKVDREFLIPIAERFRELDADGSGTLDVGVEVPAPYGWEKKSKQDADLPSPPRHAQSILTLSSRERVKVGSKVEARHNGGAQFYPGVIVREHDDSTFDIDYDDGDKEQHVGLDHIYEPPKLSELSVGQRIEARHDGGHVFYPGVVAKANDDETFAVDYDDGDSETHVLLNHIFTKGYNDVSEQNLAAAREAGAPGSPSSAVEDLGAKFELERLRSKVEDLQAQLEKVQEENARYKRIEYITNVCRVDPLTNVPINSPFKPVEVKRSPVSPLNLSDRGKVFFNEKATVTKEIEMNGGSKEGEGAPGDGGQQADEIQRKQSKKERKEKKKLKKERSKRG